mmetsp:Transcript_60168/g.188449  ORF Transcript_60168/g.188449 Transcript_60168/m.188449 type:complete len:221 (-) Transcript_60168:1767-2429(-)
MRSAISTDAAVNRPPSSQAVACALCSRASLGMAPFHCGQSRNSGENQLQRGQALLIVAPPTSSPWCASRSPHAKWSMGPKAHSAHWYARPRYCLRNCASKSCLDGAETGGCTAARSACACRAMRILLPVNMWRSRHNTTDVYASLRSMLDTARRLARGASGSTNTKRSCTGTPPSGGTTADSECKAVDSDAVSAREARTRVTSIAYGSICVAARRWTSTG